MAYIYSSQVRCVKFSPDGTKIYIAKGPKSVPAICIHDSISGEMLYEIPAQPDDINVELRAKLQFTTSSEVLVMQYPFPQFYAK